MSTGIDTETIDGYAKVICSPTHSAFINSWENVVDFLYKTRQREARTGWTFNLRYDAQALIKYLPGDILKQLYETNKAFTRKEEGYELFYISGKIFSLSFPNGKFTLCDAAQFFNSSLDNAAKTFLGEEKKHSKVIDTFKIQEGKSTGFLTEYLAENSEEIINYCKRDADLTSRLGGLIEENEKKVYGVHVETFSSNAKIGEIVTINWMRQHHQEYPHDIDSPAVGGDINYSLKNIALASYRGGWFETWQCGSFDEVTDIDINSAYPFIMNDLPHWNNGKFVFIEDKSELDTTDFYGWVFCEFECPFIPFNTRKEETWIDNIEGIDIEMRGQRKVETIVYPLGKRIQAVTLAEYLFMKEYHFKCELLCGWVWRESGAEWVKPFSWIGNIMEQKKLLKKAGKKGTMEYLMLKIVPNGCYGKTIQRVGTIKPLYSPFYASYITARTRLGIAKTILDNKLQSRVINIATDGVLLQGNTDIPTSEEFGEFEVCHYPSACVLGNGVLQIDLDKPKNGLAYFSKARGLDRTGKTDFRKLFTENKDKTELYFPEKHRPCHLGECIQHTKILSLQDLNCFIRVKKKLNLDSDKKRIWNINVFGELLDSRFAGKRHNVSEYSEATGKT